VSFFLFAFVERFFYLFFRRKLKVGELESVLDRLNAYLFELPANVRVRTEEQEARTSLILLRARVSQDGESLMWMWRRRWVSGLRSI
jgi:hypothetical protein